MVAASVPQDINSPPSMYNRLYERLVIIDTTSPEYSQAVNMDGYNTVFPEIVVFTYSGLTNVKVQVQESNDLENWRDKGTVNTMTAIGYTAGNVVTAFAATYARLKVYTTGTGTAILSAGVNLSVQ